MIWNEEISFDGFQNKIDEWYKDKDFELCDPPVSAQFALDLIFKTCVEYKVEHWIKTSSAFYFVERMVRL